MVWFCKWTRTGTNIFNPPTVICLTKHANCYPKNKPPYIFGLPKMGTHNEWGDDLSTPKHQSSISYWDIFSPNTKKWNSLKIEIKIKIHVVDREWGNSPGKQQQQQKSSFTTEKGRWKTNSAERQFQKIPHSFGHRTSPCGSHWGQKPTFPPEMVWSLRGWVFTIKTLEISQLTYSITAVCG